MLPVEAPLLDYGASGAKLREGVRLKGQPRYQKEFANRAESVKYARLGWRGRIVDCTVVKAVSTLRERGALTKPSTLTANAAMSGVKVPGK